jgi:transposase
LKRASGNLMQNSELYKKYFQHVCSSQKQQKDFSYFYKNKRYRQRLLINFNMISKIFDNNSDKSLSINKIIKLYYEQTGITIKYNTMYRFIKHDFGARFKMIKYRNEKLNNIENDIMKVLFINKYVKLVKDNYHFLWIDESGFNIMKKRPKSWIISNRNNEFFNKGRLKNTSLILCADKYRKVLSQIDTKTNNKFSFIKFLKNLNEKINDDFDLFQHKKNNKLILILDNVYFHKSDIIKNYCNRMNLNLFYLPPYNPDFNLVESCFSYLKNDFYGQNLKSL